MGEKVKKVNKFQTKIEKFLEEKGYKIEKRIGKIVLPKKEITIQFKKAGKHF